MLYPDKLKIGIDYDSQQQIVDERATLLIRAMNKAFASNEVTFAMEMCALISSTMNFFKARMSQVEKTSGPIEPADWRKRVFEDFVNDLLWQANKHLLGGKGNDFQAD